MIARWEERRGTESDWSVTCVAVDDGERSWSFEVSDAMSGRLALGDTVAVRLSPRSGRLLGLVPQDRPGGTGTGQPGGDGEAGGPDGAGEPDRAGVPGLPAG